MEIFSAIKEKIAGKPAADNAILGIQELKRYSRHLILPEVGKEGQEKIKKAKALVIGAGGLGSPAALYLAAAGIGTLGIADFDNVEESNLQRQILHAAKDAGKPKLESAKNRINELNPFVSIRLHNKKISSENAVEIIKEYDVIIDGTDSLPAKYLVNDACVLEGKPLAYGSILKFEGRASVFNYKNGPCYRCVSPKMPDYGMIPGCAEAGVLGVLPGVIGTIQATEALKVILGIGETLSGRLLIYDALAMRFIELKISRNKGCPVCGNSGTITKLEDYGISCAEKSKSEGNDEISVHELKEMMGKKEDFILVDVRENYERQACSIKEAKSAPLSHIMAGNLGCLESIGRDKKIILHCRSGARSMRALEILRSKGYTNAKSLSGGIDEWKMKIGDIVSH